MGKRGNGGGGSNGVRMAVGSDSARFVPVFSSAYGTSPKLFVAILRALERGSPRRPYAPLHSTKQSHFGYVPSNPGDFHVYDRRRQDISFGVPAGLEAL